MNENNEEKEINNIEPVTTPVVEQKEDKKKKSKKEQWKKLLLKEVLPVVAVVIAVFFIRDFLMSPVLVNGSSMDPTLHNGDVMILNKIGYKYNGINRFDIVVIKTDNTMLIKRVIGLPNENIKMVNDELYIDGTKIDQDFLEDNVHTDDFEYNTKDKCYFVMGDNREVSLDSRMLGWFDISKIIGTTKFTIYPFNRLGSKN